MSHKRSSSSGDESPIKKKPKASLSNLLMDMLNQLKSSTADDGTKIADHFLRISQLDMRVQYPMDLEIVEQKIKSDQYTNSDDLSNDVHLISANAKTFYPPTSQEFGWATALSDALHKIRIELQPLSEVSNCSTKSSSSERQTRRSNKNKKEDESDNDAASEDGTASNITSASSTMAENLQATYFSLIINYRSEDGREVAKTFRVLPSKKAYPHYYEVIKEPVDLRLIARNILNQRYETLDEMEKDLQLMVRNAKSFNEQKSSIYQDAICLQRVIKIKKQEAELIPKKQRGTRRSAAIFPGGIAPNDLCEEYANTVSPQPEDFIHPREAESDDDEISSQDEQVSDLEEVDSDDNEDLQFLNEELSLDDHSMRATGRTGRRGRPAKNKDSVNSPKTPRSNSSLNSPKKTSKGKLILSGDEMDHDESSLGSTTCSQSTLQGSASHSNRPKATLGSPSWAMVKIIERISALEGSDESNLVTNFLRLPSRRIYPDYYEDIKQPICLFMIKKKVKHREYENLKEMLDDIHLMCQNAFEYNVEGSQIYEDAQLIKKTADDAFSDLSKQYPNCLLGVHQKDSLGILALAGYTSSRASMSPGTPNTGSPTSSKSTTRKPSLAGPHRGRNRLNSEEHRLRRMTSLFNHINTHEEESGHKPQASFLELPPKDKYPDYYVKVSNPITLTIVKEKWDAGEYQSYVDMSEDLSNMLNDAKKSFSQESQYYRDASILELVLKRRLKAIQADKRREERRNEKDAVIHDSSSLGGDSTSLDSHPPTMQMYHGGAHIPSPVGGFYSNSSQIMMPYGMSIQQNHLDINKPVMTKEQIMMCQVFQAVRLYKEGDRCISDPFWRLPVKEDLPEYYKYIRKPIEMLAIGCNLLNNVYSDFDSFMDDMFLMFDNACKFNEPVSQIYKDSVLLHRVALYKRNCLLNPSLIGKEDDPKSSPTFHVPQSEVQHAFRKMITHLHNALLTAVDPEGRGLVDSLIAGDGTEIAPTSSTAVRLEALHKAVAQSLYTRLDHFQHDWLEVLKRARQGEAGCGTTLQQRLDAIELTKRWLKVRDEYLAKIASPNPPESEIPLQSLKRTHQCITTASSTFTSADLQSILAQEDIDFPIKRFSDDSAEGEPTPLDLTYSTIEMLPLNNDDTQVLRLGEYIYFKPSDASESCKMSIGRILRIAVPSGEDPQKSLISVAHYMTPEEAKPSRRRRLLSNEVFRTAIVKEISLSQYNGKCLVTSIHNFARLIPINFEAKDIYICETHFSLEGMVFLKIQGLMQSLHEPVSVEWSNKPQPRLPIRLPPNEPLPSVLAQVSKTNYDWMEFPSPQIYQNIASPTQDLENKNIQLFEQIATGNSFIKLGDYVYIKSSPPSLTMPRDIARLDKIWLDTTTKKYYFSGPKFVQPMTVEHMPTRLFMPNEIYMSDSSHTTYEMQDIQSKCHIMRPADFVMARPPEYSESDVYVCNSKYFEREKVIRKLKTGLKRFTLSSGCIEDEYFMIAYMPLRKEGSKLLSQISPEPLNQTFLTQPVDVAVTFTQSVCDLQKAANMKPPLCGYQQGKQPAPAFHPMITAPQGASGTMPQCYVIPPQPEMIKTTVVSADGMLISQQQIVPQSGVMMPPNSVDMNRSFGSPGPSNLEGSAKKKKTRKPPSGYVIYAGEIRKKMAETMKGAAFGDISREVGLMWRKLPSNERDTYERKAQLLKKQIEEEIRREKEQERREAAKMITVPQPTPGAMVQGPRPTVQWSGMPPNSNGLPTQTPTQMYIAGDPSTMVQTPVGLVSAGNPPHVLAQGQQYFKTPTGQVVQLAQPNSGVVPSVNHQGNQMVVPQNMHSVVMGNNAQQTIPNQGQQQIVQPSRPPSPVFVPVPPRMTRVLHSEVYQKYIERLKRGMNNPYNNQISDWRGQMSASQEFYQARQNNAISKSQNPRSVQQQVVVQEQNLASSFLSMCRIPNTGSHSTVEALWNLRDHLLQDALEIRNRYSPCVTIESL